jgi:signal transduction histidine kinase
LHLSLRTKTILGTAIIEGALLILLIFVATRFFTDTLNQNLQERAETTATLFATMTKDAVLSFDLATLDTFLDEVLSNPDIAYARVLDKDGNTFAQKGNSEQLTKTFIADYDLSIVDDGIYDSFAAIEEADIVYGRVEIGIVISELQQSLNKITSWALSIALTEMALVGLFSWFLGNYLTLQLRKLKDATGEIQDSISTGDFSNARVDIRGKDEVAEVAAAFNTLADKLELQNQQTLVYQNELKAFNSKLEELVEKRTEQLATKNSELQSTFDELKLAQQQLIQTEKMASMGQLAAGLAHEINNPVGFVKSNVGSLSRYTHSFIQLHALVNELMHSGDTSERDQLIEDLKALCENEDFDFISEDAKELLIDIKEGLARVIDIVQNMSVFSRVDSDAKQIFNVNRCIETTAKMAKKQIERQGSIKLILGKLPDTLINVGKINQVLTNLIVNAAQAIEENGQVIVKSRQEGDKLKITVVDTGKGIAEAHLERIFDPFFTTKPEGEGTGLGLSISFDIVKEHGGQLSVSSKVGKGTIFTIILPVVNESAAQELA